ncbi:MAG: DGQHR domain-containing protein [Bacillota bacterium]
MLFGIQPVAELRGLARVRARDYETKTVHPLLSEEYQAKGWDTVTKGKSVRLKRVKAHNVRLEDRVWMLLYKMGFSDLSGQNGASLLVNPKEPDGPKSQIDVVGIDNEIALAIECKSAEKYSKRPQFQEEIGKHSLIRNNFSNAVNSQFPCEYKRQVVLAMFLANISLSDNNRDRARDANIILFDEQDLTYYERLISQVGPAAKFQFFSDMLPDKPIQGLRIRVPAVRTKMGGFNCYSFCISPEYLLKISFVSHRAKGKASDVNTYQRMMKKSRLKTIGEYITNDGIFPTNIVVNIDKKRLQFERIHQEGDQFTDTNSGVLGWLEIRPTYKSAWIIDGQHRLFAYSGHPRATRSLLSVLAFEGLLSSKQAELFIDINAKQKRVKQSLLQELYAELHWDAEESKIRVRAIVSKAIQDLDRDPESPFFHRIQTADDEKSYTRCITLNSMYSAIEKRGFHIAKEKHGHVIDYGPLWAGDNYATLRRTTNTLKNWFNFIRYEAEDWWDKGSGEGGGLAMNDAIIACIDVLRSVFQHLEGTGHKLVHLDNDDLIECIRSYGEVLGRYLGSLTELERSQFRSLRGIQGQTTRKRRAEQAIRSTFPEFNPPGLDDFLASEKAQTNSKAKDIVSRIEIILQNLIMEELRREYGADEAQWWVMGVPKSVRLKVTEKYEKDDGKRGGKEYYFDLIDYKKIAVENWDIFEPLLANGKKGSKDKRTEWLDFLNEKRNILFHSSSGISISLDALNQLQEYEKWLNRQINTSNNMTDSYNSASSSQFRFLG